MKNVLKIFGITILASAILAGCYPKEDLNYSDLDIAVSHHDVNFNFNALAGKVCVIFDTVAHVVDEDADVPEGKYDDLIIAEVLKNLNTTAFDTVYLVKDSSDIIPGREPDMGVTITAWETDFYNYNYYPWYDYWYWGWGWGWYYKSGSLKSAQNINYYYYPWYPWGGGYYYSYTTGTIVIDIVNASEMERPNSKGDQIELPIIWTGILNGIVSDSKSGAESRISNEIEQVFTQSTYLYN